MATRIVDIAKAHREHTAGILRREWLVTNGLGGYASGTLCGAVTRRYHGLLVAALLGTLGRVVMLNHLLESLLLPDGSQFVLGGDDFADADVEPRISQFRLEWGLPIWVYEAAGYVIEKRLLMVHGQNTVHVSYTLLSGPGPVGFALRPSVHFRSHENAVDENLGDDYSVSLKGAQYEIHASKNIPALRLFLDSSSNGFVYERNALREMFYSTEAERGYAAVGRLWSPGYLNTTLQPGSTTTLVASTESWETIMALNPVMAKEAELERRERLVAMAEPAASEGAGAEFVLAADQFIIQPAGRIEDKARAQAAGDEIRTVIAGYHWFTDWGRDTMISLEGLTLTTGRNKEAGWILRTFAHYIHHGLIPNLFPEGKSKGLYHTADATLWFFHAVDRYLQTTHDRETLKLLLPKLVEIAEAHLRGTDFGIGVDPTDGLLRQGAEGYQLTWMDAKVDGWVVTPRRGKAVEINALWYNALRLLQGWLVESDQKETASAFGQHADKAYDSFNQRFWSDSQGYLLDIVDGEQGDDSALRPNQIIAISLHHPVLEEQHWSAVLETVQRELVTPVGLRSLARNHPDYKPRYDGDLRARDAAYHQGTVWGWLLGPFIDTWMKVRPDDHAGAREFLVPLASHLQEACIGSISEIFDAEAPFTPRGCIAQAWSVAEALRCWVKTAPPNRSTSGKGIQT